jgi:type III restriction enzyme
MTSVTLNSTTLEPLFAPWAEPNAHRVRAEKVGDPAVIVQGRKTSPIDLVSNLRSAVRDWREAFYIGASDTTIQLLNHWFGRAHRQTTASGEDFLTLPFSMSGFFCPDTKRRPADYAANVHDIASG